LAAAFAVVARAGDAGLAFGAALLTATVRGGFTAFAFTAGFAAVFATEAFAAAFSAGAGFALAFAGDGFTAAFGAGFAVARVGVRLPTDFLAVLLAGLAGIALSLSLRESADIPVPVQIHRDYRLLYIPP